MNESLEVLVGYEEHEYAVGHVVAIHHLKNAFDIALEGSGQLLTRVPRNDLRRRDGGAHPAE